MGAKSAREKQLRRKKSFGGRFLGQFRQPGSDITGDPPSSASVQITSPKAENSRWSKGWKKLLRRQPKEAQGEDEQKECKAELNKPNHNRVLSGKLQKKDR